MPKPQQIDGLRKEHEEILIERKIIRRSEKQEFTVTMIGIVTLFLASMIIISELL